MADETCFGKTHIKQISGRTTMIGGGVKPLETLGKKNFFSSKEKMDEK